MRNSFYRGDCKFVMEHDIVPESIDLIYLDPPFYTGQIQKGEVKSSWNPGAMEVSYDDSRKFWSEKGLADKAPDWMKHIASKNNERAAFAAYLYYMMERLELCKKVLKSTGSIYLHCDWRASHYLKMVMDEIFADRNFQNEIVWHYRGRGMQQRRFQRKHDIIFFYTKGEPRFNADNILVPLDPKHTSRYNKTDENGNSYALIKGHNGSYSKIYRKDGIVPDDVWDIPFIHGDEAVGYPTQKPIALLERIITASSNEGDIVLDPFCGCGTTIIAAHKLNRRWIGIDINRFAYEVTSSRFANPIAQTMAQMPLGMTADSTADYISRDYEEVKTLTPAEFEQWVNTFYKARNPNRDKGVDGIMQDGTPIQTKTWEVDHSVVSQLLGDAQVHPEVPQPVKKMMIVSMTGFDNSAKSTAFQIESKFGIVIKLLPLKDILEVNKVK